MKLCLKAKYVSEDPQRRLEYCTDLGFTATQESAKSIPGAVERGWPTGAELIAHKRPFAAAGVEVVALEPVEEPLTSWVESTAAGRESFERFGRHLDAAGEAGIPCVTLHPPLDHPRSPDEGAEQFRRNVDFYARAAERARRAGTKLATHSPYGIRRGPRPAGSADGASGGAAGGATGEVAGGAKVLSKPLWGAGEFGALFDAVPDEANGLIYCFGCMVMADGDALERMARFIPRTFFVHVRDVVLHPDGSFDEVWPGQGNVQPEAAIRRLWELGYRGPITPEHNPSVYGEPYAGPISTAYSAGWCLAILKELAGA